MGGDPFLLKGPDNDSWMYTNAPHCSGCSLVTDDEWVDPTFQLARRVSAFSCTYDGAVIVSESFAEAVAGERGVAFTPVAVEGYYVMRVTHEVRFDAVRRETRFGPRCKVCNRFESVTGAIPVFLRPDAVVKNGFARTDLAFGDAADFGPAQPVRLAPLILAAPALARRLERMHFPGLLLVPVAT